LFCACAGCTIHQWIHFLATTRFCNVHPCLHIPSLQFLVSHGF
jgi:hypothetical protein